jgi:hypothetical protein
VIPATRNTGVFMLEQAVKTNMGVDIRFYDLSLGILSSRVTSFTDLGDFTSRERSSWLRHCATSRKVAISIPDGVIGIFH